MASILEFRQPALGSRQMTTRRGVVASADIVFFPGVRYERWAEADARPAEKPRHRTRRRDHLDLDD